MSTDLSPDMTEALRRCRETGGLKYVRGGFWIEAMQDPEPFERLNDKGTGYALQGRQLPWHTTAHTIKALVKRGLVREAEKHPDGYLIRVEAT